MLDELLATTGSCGTPRHAFARRRLRIARRSRAGHGRDRGGGGVGVRSLALRRRPARQLALARAVAPVRPDLLGCVGRIRRPRRRRRLRARVRRAPRRRRSLDDRAPGRLQPGARGRARRLAHGGPARVPMGDRPRGHAPAPPRHAPAEPREPRPAGACSSSCRRAYGGPAPTTTRSSLRLQQWQQVRDVVVATQDDALRLGDDLADRRVVGAGERESARAVTRCNSWPITPPCDTTTTRWSGCAATMRWKPRHTRSSNSSCGSAPGMTSQRSSTKICSKIGSPSHPRGAGTRPLPSRRGTPRAGRARRSV